MLCSNINHLEEARGEVGDGGVRETVFGRRLEFWVCFSFETMTIKRPKGTKKRNLGGDEEKSKIML